MERPYSISSKIALGFLIIIYAVGITGHLIVPVREYMILLTPYTLLICGVVVYLAFRPGKRFNLWFLGTYAVTFAFEGLGVHTGFVFGDYFYGEVLGPVLLGVPLIIGLNWVFVILGSTQIALRINSRILPASLIAGLIAVIFDFFLEPAAIKLGYWTWTEGEVPILNYATWFVLAFGAAFVYIKIGLRRENLVPAYYLIIQYLFFLVLNIAL